MKIVDVYRSVQGEGVLTGTPSVFVRASGCNLRCWYCDTPYASWLPEGVDNTVDEIIAQVEEWDCPHVVLTGGEPMLFAELLPLAEGLKGIGRHVTVETAGTLYLPVACDLMSLSPKLSGSGPSSEDHPRWRRRHHRLRYQPDVLRRLLIEYNHQLKFVIDRPAELEEVAAMLRELPEADPKRILMMPQGVTAEHLQRRARWLEPACAERGWTYCPRRQIEWFGTVRGT